MSRLDQLILDAQKLRRKKLVLGTSVAAIILLIAVVAYVITAYVDRIEVVVTPTEVAQTAQLEILDGRGYVWNDSVFGTRETLKLRVTAAGFRPQEVEVTDSTWRRGKIDIVLQPLPAKLVATTTPLMPDVHWYLNDKFVARGQPFSSEVNPGQYTIGARHPNFEPAQQEVLLERAQNYEFEFQLAPVKGRLGISSQPEGARVELNSAPVGETPLELTVDAGTYEVSISHQGHTTRTDLVRISSDEREVNRHYELAIMNATVSFALSPADGILTLDNISVPAGETASVSLPVESRHAVQYSKPGFRSQIVEFAVRQNADNRIRIDLEPVYGLVEVISEPVAEVSVGGKAVGQTPQQLELQTLEHTITVSRSGYISESRIITPDENSNQLMYVTLESEQDFRLRTSPQSYTNSIGMEFNLFKQPDSVTLGSRTSEEGRRANEFIREVRLTRPFYAGVHEVTVGQFLQFRTTGQPASVNRLPITGINWAEAANFCNWLSKKEGFRPVYEFSGNEVTASDSAADGYRMLTEAEWEWLARKAGKFTQSIFPWGDSTTVPPNTGNLADESAKGKLQFYIPRYNDRQPGASDIGLFQPNSVGIHDLAGNVSEWTHDVYNLVPPVDNEVEIDPFDSSVSKWHTVKGSSWRSARLGELRAAFRQGSSGSSDVIGFRVARYLY